MFTIMCPKEQQTSDSLIVKDNCFIIEIFNKFSFSGILRGCLSHLRSIAKAKICYAELKIPTLAKWLISPLVRVIIKICKSASC